MIPNFLNPILPTAGTANATPIPAAGQAALHAVAQGQGEATAPAEFLTDLLLLMATGGKTSVAEGTDAPTETPSAEAPKEGTDEIAVEIPFGAVFVEPVSDASSEKTSAATLMNSAAPAGALSSKANKGLSAPVLPGSEPVEKAAVFASAAQGGATQGETPGAGVADTDTKTDGSAGGAPPVSVAGETKAPADAVVQPADPAGAEGASASGKEGETNASKAGSAAEASLRAGTAPSEPKTEVVAKESTDSVGTLQGRIVEGSKPDAATGQPHEHEEKDASPRRGAAPHEAVTENPALSADEEATETDFESLLTTEGLEEEDSLAPDPAARRGAVTAGREGEAGKVQVSTGSETVDDADAGRAGGSHHLRAEKAGAGTETARPAPTARPASSGMVNQLVDRAVFLQRNGQAEMQIDLKPEHLGRIRMRISTESQRVTVHMMAETHAAREIIEANLGQLRNDLASQGLEVDRFDVNTMASNDSDRQGRGAFQSGSRGRFSAAAGADGQTVVDSTDVPAAHFQTSKDRSVDYFA